MSKTIQLAIPGEEIANFCRRWQVTELALFGSVLRPDFSDHSDVDVLVTFAPSVKPSVVDRVDMAEELTVILGRKVDLVERRAIEESNNYIRRNQILGSAEVIYGP
jgi:predicted nucleotidyltransferase